jgi:hypothetical protein
MRLVHVVLPAPRTGRGARHGAFPSPILILWFLASCRRPIETPMGRHESDRRSLAIELQTSASLVDATLQLLSEHWPQLSDDRRRQALTAARERAHHVAMRLDEVVGAPAGPTSDHADRQPVDTPGHEVQ